MISKTPFCVLSIFVLVLLTLPSQASNADQAGFDLPKPNGCYLVGTRTTVLGDPRSSRDLLVTMWYPAILRHGRLDKHCSSILHSPLLRRHTELAPAAFSVTATSRGGREIWTTPAGDKVAWFKDNVLSVSQH